MGQSQPVHVQPPVARLRQQTLKQMKKANLPPGSPQSKVDEAEPISSREAVEFAVAFAKERRAKAQALEKVNLRLAQSHSRIIGPWTAHLCLQHDCAIEPLFV